MIEKYYLVSYAYKLLKTDLNKLQLDFLDQTGMTYEVFEDTFRARMRQSETLKFTTKKIIDKINSEIKQKYAQKGK